MKQYIEYIAHCKGCKKELKDPADKPIYVVRAKKPRNQKTDEGEYWCSQRCMNKNDPERIEAIKAAKEIAE